MKRVIVQIHEKSILFTCIKKGESAIYIDAAGNDLRIGGFHMINVGVVRWFLIKAIAWLFSIGMKKEDIFYQEWRGEVKT